MRGYVILTDPGKVISIDEMVNLICDQVQGSNLSQFVRETVIKGLESVKSDDNA